MEYHRVHGNRKLYTQLPIWLEFVSLHARITTTSTTQAQTRSHFTIYMLAMPALAGYRNGNIDVVYY